MLNSFFRNSNICYRLKTSVQHVIVGSVLPSAVFSSVSSSIRPWSSFLSWFCCSCMASRSLSAACRWFSRRSVSASTSSSFSNKERLRNSTMSFFSFSSVLYWVFKSFFCLSSSSLLSWYLDENKGKETYSKDNVMILARDTVF